MFGLLLSDAVNFIVNVLLIVLMIGVLVFVHELGHFIVAKLSGMYVEEFALGMGPVVFSKVVGETKYALRLFPVGGFVQIFGEEEYEAKDRNDEMALKTEGKKVTVDGKKSKKTSDKDKKLRSFKKQPVYSRLAVMLAGVTANFMLTAVLYYVLLFVTGFMWELDATSQEFTPWFGDVSLVRQSDVFYSDIVNGGGADLAGMPESGIIQTVDGVELVYSTDLPQILTEFKERQVDLVVCENVDGSEFSGCAVYNVGVSDKGVMGVMLPPNYKIEVAYTGLTKFAGGFVHALNQIQIISVYVPQFFRAAVQQGEYEIAIAGSMTSPIGMYFMIDKVKEYGVGAVVEVLAGLSLSLCLINLVPLPALDGGRAVLLLPELITGKPINARLEEILIKVSFYGLFIFMFIIVLKDVILIDVFRSMF